MFQNISSQVFCKIKKKKKSRLFFKNQTKSHPDMHEICFSLGVVTADNAYSEGQGYR